uniref:Arrestin, beta 1 n=1 Tax=Amphiprion percula TaxID=161767 RepID=A0A3P8TXV9_AMPPE
RHVSCKLQRGGPCHPLFIQVGSLWTKPSVLLQLTVYLGKRDFVDHVDLVEAVDGVVLIDPEYLKERKVSIA